jgi:hypothetical protein
MKPSPGGAAGVYEWTNQVPKAKYAAPSSRPNSGGLAIPNMRLFSTRPAGRTSDQPIRAMNSRRNGLDEPDGGCCGAAKFVKLTSR